MNAVKYANASLVTIVVRARERVVHALIEDDGVGFALDKIRDGALGLVGMQERVMLLGGRFEIDTTPRAGTTLVVALPRQNARNRTCRCVGCAGGSGDGCGGGSEHTRRPGRGDRRGRYREELYGRDN